LIPHAKTVSLSKHTMPTPTTETYQTSLKKKEKKRRKKPHG
jgi:hypothetical protein